MATLLAYPNVSDGRDAQTIAAVGHALGPGLLDVHADPDHHRSAYTLAGAPGELAGYVVAGAREALGRIALDTHLGAHPRVGVLDVAPVVHLHDEDRGAACVEALVLADRLGDELELPVFLYGELGGGRTRAELRRGGATELARRVGAGELRPDFGPVAIDPARGATLVAARPPLVAFNLRLHPRATLSEARRVAAAIREGAPAGLPGVRAIGVWLESRGCAQVSTNLEDWKASGPATVVAAVSRHVTVAEAELVGLAPAAALANLPRSLPFVGRATIEERLAARGRSV